MRLWTSAQPAVANYVHALVRDRGAAQDVLQETALVIFRRFADYDGQRPFLAWALGIARFQVLGIQRDAARSRVAFDEHLHRVFPEARASVTENSSTTRRLGPFDIRVALKLRIGRARRCLRALRLESIGLFPSGSSRTA